MLAPTHSVFGIFLTLTILAIFGVQASLHWTIILAGIIGSLVPDLDMPKSMIGRVFFFISVPLERRFGHRTITHSLLGWLIATLIFTVLITILTFLTSYGIQTFFPNGVPLYFGILSIDLGLTTRWVAAFSIGYISHLILDMFTLRGSQFFWPEPSRDVIPKNSKYRIETGSKFEIIIFAILFGCMVVSFPISQYGLMTSLRWLLATPEAAIEEFKTLNTKTYIQFEGMVNQTKAPVSGWAEILDVQNKRLVVRICVTPPFGDQLSSNTTPSPLETIFSKLTNPFTNKADQTQPTSNGLPSADRTEQPAIPTTSPTKQTPSQPPSFPLNVSGIYTLSDELTADIIAQHVKFKKTEIPIVIDHRIFQDRTREDLESKVSDNALISGTIYLPEGLKAIQSQDQNQSDLKAITQSENKLILYFATKSQLKALQLDAQFQYQLKADQLQVKSIDLKINRIKNEIYNLQHPNDGLTDLGRKVIGDPDRPRREARIGKLTQDLEELALEKEGLELKLKMKQLLFSGEVWIRL